MHTGSPRAQTVPARSGPRALRRHVECSEDSGRNRGGGDGLQAQLADLASPRPTPRLQDDDAPTASSSLRRATALPSDSPCAWGPRQPHADSCPPAPPVNLTPCTSACVWAGERRAQGVPSERADGVPGPRARALRLGRRRHVLRCFGWTCRTGGSLCSALQSASWGAQAWRGGARGARGGWPLCPPDTETSAAASCSF